MGQPASQYGMPKFQEELKIKWKQQGQGLCSLTNPKPWSEGASQKKKKAYCSCVANDENGNKRRRGTYILFLLGQFLRFRSFEVKDQNAPH